MRSIKVMLLMLFSITLSGATFAQTRELTLKEALNYAVQNNETVRKSRLDIEGGKHKTAEIRAQALPQINANGGLTYNPIIGQLVVGDQSFQMGRAWNAQAGVQVDQQLFNQQVFTGLKAAKESESYYALNAELTEEQVIEQTANNYYQVLVNREQLGVIDTNIKNVKTIERIIADQYKNGLAKKIDLDRIKVNLTNLYTQKEQLENAITLLLNQLKISMGMPVSTPITLPESDLNAVKALPAFSSDFDIKNRTEFKILDVQNNLLGLQKKAYTSEYYPSLALTGNYSYTGMSDRMDLFRPNSSAFWYDASAVGLTLRIPLFNGFATRSRVRQADVEIQKLQEDRRQLNNSLNAGYENAVIQLKNNFNTIQAQEQNVSLAKEIYSSTQNNYNNGLASLTDLLDTENALTEAQNNYNQALLNYKLAEIQLIKSKGNISSLLE